MKKSRTEPEHLVLPIKDTNILHQVENALYNNFRLGIRNYTIFKTGMVTLLRVSDVLRLKYDSIFDKNGNVYHTAHINDKKTTKGNTIILDAVKIDLEKYREWLLNYLHSHNNYYQQWIDGGKWLFTSSRNVGKHFNEKPFYFAMRKTGTELHLPYLGTHTMRKTGAYIAYEQSGKDIAFVMHLLNHSSQAMTLRYLGIDREEKESKYKKIDFNKIS